MRKINFCCVNVLNTRCLIFKLNNCTLKSLNNLLMKQTSLFIALFIIHCLLFTVKAQNPKIDSLTNILQQHTEKDTVRINLLIDLARTTVNIDQKRSIKYAEEALKLASMLDFKKGKALSLYSLGFCYYLMTDYQKSLDYWLKSLDIYEVLGNKLEVSSCLHDIGLIYERQGNYSLSLEYFQKALKIYEEAGSKQKTSSCLHDIGLLYERQGNYPLSLEHYQKALKINEESGSKKQIANCLNNIGLIYKEQGNYTLALTYYQKSFKIHEETGDMKGIGTCFNNIGEVYIKQGNYTLALTYYQKSLKISLKIGDKSLMAIIMNNIGTIYYYQGNFTLAFDYFQKALKISEEVNSKLIISECYANLGLNYLGTLNFKKALDYTQKSLIIARELKLLNEQRRMHLQISEIYTATKDYKKALESYILYKELNDSIFSEKNIKKITRLEYQYEFEKEKQTIELEQQKKDAISAEKLKRQKTARNFIILFAILLIILVCLIYRNYKNKQLADKMKLRFFTNISHELRTPLTLLISPLERMSAKFKENDEDNLVPIMLKNTNKLKNLINQLLDISKIETESLTLVKDYYEFNNVFKTTTSMFVSMAQDKNIDFRVSIENQGFVFYFDKERIEHVISNLLSNAFKFTPEGGQINASVSKHDDYLSLSIKDTGIGISPDDIGKVFKRFYQSSKDNNSSYEGTGIGLNIVKEYVELHDGTVSVKSELGKGSEFLVKLPLYELNTELNEQSETEILLDSGEKLSNNKEKIQDRKELETLLIVEDNLDLRNYLKSIFQNRYNVLEASNGEVGKQIASKENPELVISDVMMPVCDGYCLTEYLKSQIETSHIPIILLTAKASHDDKLTGYELGADDYIAKPFNEKELVLKVYNSLLTRKKQKEKYSKNITINSSEIVATSIDEQLLQKIVQIIEQNISNVDFSIDQLCVEVGISRRNMFRKLKALTDMSPSQFIRAFRLKRAAQLLSQKAGSVSEIAYQTGFDHLSYFTKCFKETYQKLPSEYV